MPQKPNTLYPEGYIEPSPPDPPPDDETTGRDFARLVVIIRNSVPVDGEPMTTRQLGYIVYGRESRDGTWVTVGVDSPAQIRAAALGLTTAARNVGIIAEPACVSIHPSEARVVFDGIVAERESTWTFLPE
jgi:hypothetical protein